MDPTGSELTGVVLAAGRGLRLAALQSGMPKCLLPIGNRPLIDHHYAIFSALRIRRAHVMIGSDTEPLTPRFPQPTGLDVTFHVQESREGIAQALLQLRPQLDGPFLLILGDIYLHNPDLTRPALRFANSKSQCILMGRPNSSPYELSQSFSIDHDARGEVSAVREKPRPIAGLTRGCGVYFFKPSIFEAIERTPVSQLRQERELTDAVQTLINAGGRVIMEKSQTWDYNINTPSDLLECNLALVQEQGHSIVHESASIPDGCMVERSVIGPGVTADGPVSIRESVVFEGTHIRGSAAIVRSLVLPGQVHPCGDTAA